MSNAQHRRNTLLVNLNSLASWGAAYLVTAYEPGAQVTSDVTGTGITVRAGHGFAAGDKLMVGTDTTKFRTISGSPGATTIVVTSSVTVAANDYLVNLGPDTGTTTPNYDGSGRSIYLDMDTAGSAITASRVTADAQGVYSYWHDGFEIWELVRTAAGTPVAVIPGADGGFIRAGNSGDLFFFRNDTVQALQITGQVESSAVGAGSWYGRVPTAAVGMNLAIPLVLAQDNVVSSPTGSSQIFDITGASMGGGTQFLQIQGQSRLDLAANGGAGGRSFIPFEQSGVARVGPSVAQSSNYWLGRFSLLWSEGADGTPAAWAGTMATMYALWGRWSYGSTATNTGSTTVAAGVVATMDLQSASGTHTFGTASGIFQQTLATAAAGTTTVTTLNGINSTIAQSGAGMATTNLRGASITAAFSAGTVTTMTGINTSTTISGTVNPTTAYGVLNTVNKSSTGTTTNLFGKYIDWNLSSTGTVTNAIAQRIDMTMSAAGTITTGRQLFISAPSNSGAGTWTTHTGLYIATPTSAFTAGTYFGALIEYPTTQTTSSHANTQLCLVPKNMAGVDPAQANLPTANATTVGSIVMMRNAATNDQTKNGPYVCVQTGASTYAWMKITLATVA